MRVTSYLMKRFRAPESALSFFEGHTPMPVQPPVLHYRDNSTQTYAHSSDVLAQMKTLLTALPEEEQASTIGQLMQYIAPPDVNVPPDFIKHALACMKNHTAAGRSNILAGLAKALGTKRPDGSSRMPVSEMPVGLLEPVFSHLTRFIRYVFPVDEICISYIFPLVCIGYSLSGGLQALVRVHVLPLWDKVDEDPWWSSVVSGSCDSRPKPLFGYIKKNF